MAAEWYFKVRGTEFGPVSPSELVQNAADERITPETEVRKEPENFLAQPFVLSI